MLPNYLRKESYNLQKCSMKTIVIIVGLCCITLTGCGYQYRQFIQQQKNREGIALREEIAETTNQHRLSEIAIRHSTNYANSVGEDAVKKITDQSELANVAINASSGRVASSALGKVTDPKYLVKVAIEARPRTMESFYMPQGYLAPGGMMIRRGASVQYYNPGRKAVEYNSISINKMAIDKLTDKADIEYVSLYAKEVRVKSYAIERLHNSQSH